MEKNQGVVWAILCSVGVNGNCLTGVSVREYLVIYIPYNIEHVDFYLSDTVNFFFLAPGVGVCPGLRIIACSTRRAPHLLSTLRLIGYAVDKDSASITV